ncbi:MAG: DUF58 domain-containing protein [candidate division WOR-3 bacterium]|nr:DUF58 domain-containing protein [candidate division WOR-3 bacterium]
MKKSEARSRAGASSLKRNASGSDRVSAGHIRQIEIRTRRLVNTLFSGDYKSSFKGRGIEFLDVREYLPGDDVRTIDWKVTARFGRPYVKKFAEERELVVILLVDASGSDRFGTKRLFKLEQAAQVAATLAFSAIRNNDKVGLVFFTDRIEKYVPSKKGRVHVLRLIRDILYFEPERRGTDAGQALEFLMHVLKRRAIVFLISDLMGDSYRPEAIRQPLGIVARKHDLVVVSVNDPAEKELPRLGLVEMEDAETGELATVDTSDPVLRKRFAASQAARQEAVERLFRQLGIDHVPVSTAEDFTKKLHQFFQKRARRYR